MEIPILSSFFHIIQLTDLRFGLKLILYDNFSLFQFQYVHKWSPGDFIISDNLALGHEASPQTQSGDVL